MTLWLHRTIVAYGVALAPLATAPCVGTAQSLKYSYRSGDTVRFIETLEVTGTSTGRGGTLNVGVRRDARIALAFAATDTVKAWYDSLAMESSGPNGLRRAETQSILRVPFVLRVRTDGQVRTILTPTLPDIVRQLAELYPPFDDFLAPLPKDITAGSTRTDTLVRRETAGDRRVSMRRIVRTRVERDTLAGTLSAVVLGIQSTLHIEVSASAPGGDLRTELRLDGNEKGFAVVSKTGALLHRSRTGDAHGSTTYTGRGAKVTVPQIYSYRAVIRTVEK